METAVNEILERLDELQGRESRAVKNAVVVALFDLEQHMSAMSAAMVRLRDAVTPATV